MSNVTTFYNPDDPRFADGIANVRLKEYLDNHPEEIKPVRMAFRDAVFGYNAISCVTSFMAVPSGMYSTLPDADGGESPNYFRISSGLIACATYAMSSIGIFYGRYQIYCDLRDYKNGVDPNLIMQRDDSKNPFVRATNYGIDNVVKITAGVGIATSLLTIASGWASGRWGEAITGAVGIPSYVVRILPHKKPGEAPKEKSKIIRQAFAAAAATTEPFANMFSVATEFMTGKKFAETDLGKKIKLIGSKPMLLSAFLSAGKRTPGFISACVALDPFQMAQYGGAYAGDAMIADMEKRAICRRYSIVDERVQPDAFKIAENLLEKKPFHAMRRLFKTSAAPA